MRQDKVLFFGRKMIKSGGVEAYMLNLASNLKKDIPIDILITDETEEEKDYLKEIKQTFNNIYRTPTHKENLLKHIIEVYKISKAYKNGIIHIHSSNGFHAIDGMIAKMAGVKNVVFHSHNASFKKNIGLSFSRVLFQIFGDYFLGCSQAAGEYLFGDRIVSSNKFLVAKNAVDIETFKFEAQKRNNIRTEFNIPEDTKLLGFVGRFSPEKNVDFIIEVFSKLLKSEPDTKLMLVGDGEKLEEIITLAQKYNIEDRIVFTGVRDDVDSIMSALDILLLPSDFESLGIVLIEGQTSGLKCLASTNVANEAKISNRLIYLDLIVDEWVDKIKLLNIDMDREHSYKDAIETGYGAQDSARKIKELYKEILKK